MLRRTLRRARRLLAPVGRVLVVPARWLAHVIMFPIDVAFLFFDLFFVNLKKTRIFSHDCRGRHSFRGGVCPPSRKYTNRFLFRLLCPEMGRGLEGRGICRADEKVKVHLMRGAALAIAIVVIVGGANLAVVRFWPRLTGAEPPAEKLERLLAERVTGGNAAFEAGQYEDALSFFRGALRIASDDRELWHKAGLTYAEMGEQAKAVQCFRVAAEGDDAYPPALGRLALYLYEKGDVGPAGSYAERAVRLGGADGPTHAILADRYLWTGDTDSAAAHLQNAVDKDPESDIVRLAQAHSLMLEGNLDEAGRLLDGIADDAPVAPLAALYRMDVLWKTGRSQEAVERLKEVADKHAELPWLAMLSLDSQFASGRRAEALAEVKRLEERFADLPAARLDLGRLLGKRGLDGLALQVALGCEDEPGVELPARVFAGELYLRRGLPDLAEDYARRALLEDAGHPAALLLAGKAALAKRDADEAARRFNDVVKAAPESAEAWYLLATAQRAQRDLEAACQSFLKACELRPDSGPFRQDCGRMLLATGKKAEAREQFLRAAELLPRPYAPYTSLGMMAQEEGDNAKAREYYVKAIEAAPDRSIIAANNMAELLLSENKDIPLALAFAYSAHVRAFGTPLEAPAADTLANALIRAGYPASAVGLARMAARIRPDSPERHYRRGLAEAAAGNLEEALRAFDKAAELDPDSESAVLARGLAEMLKQREKERQEAAPEAAAPKEEG